jgi:hypothetical protein
MLNDISEAAGHPEVTRPKSPPRKPWDGGGYSLPLQSTTFGSFTGLAPHDESQWEGQADQFRHKMSDSHGSLSSFVSSDNPSHSRFASSSTVSSVYAFSPIATDGTFTDLETESHSSKTGASSPSPVSPFSIRSRPYASPTLAEGIGRLDLVLEDAIYRQPQGEPIYRPVLRLDMAGPGTVRMGKRKAEDSAPTPQRPASPSDAVLFKRASVSKDPSPAESPGATIAESFERHQP